MKELDAAAQKEFANFLVSTLDADQLDELVHLATGNHLFDAYAGEGSPFKTIARELITGLEKEGTTPLFAAVLYQERKHKADLRQFLRAHFPHVADLSQVGVEQQEQGVPMPDLDRQAALQRMVNARLGHLDMRDWLKRATSIMGAVGRVERDGTGVGTAFLVADGLALTNWHVLDAVRGAGGLDRMGVRFDYHRGASGVEPGTLIPVAEVIDERPCSAAELKNDVDTPPTPDELDYALLRLAKGTPDRQAIALGPGAPVGQGDGILIVQHPQAGTLKFTDDDRAVIGTVHDGLRLRYTTNTEHGSSGSPCFTRELDLVALHHLGDPSFGAPKFNQGIPIGLVLASIRQRAPDALPPGPAS